LRAGKTAAESLFRVKFHRSASDRSDRAEAQQARLADRIARTGTAVIVSMEVVFAAIAGYLLLGEPLSPIGWAGAGLILSATLLLQLWPALAPRLLRRSS
jgi:hypothetical protein